MGNEPNPSRGRDVEAAEPELGADEEPGTDENQTGEISPVDFTMLVLSLNASALIHLGEPISAEAEPLPEAKLDLPMARNAIDMLCMLEHKTRGNLTGEEERLLNQVLIDLRLRYASAAGT